VEAKGSRLDAHLAHVFSDLSRSRVQSLIGEGRIRVDGRASKPAARLRGGEEIELELPPPRQSRAQAEDLPLEVLYDDRDLLVVNKAARMVVHPAAGHATGTLVNALLHRVKDLDVGGEQRPGIVHRLDKDTSGCLVVAKRTAILETLQAAFKAREVEKIYAALVHGDPPDELRIDTPYGRHPVHRQRFSGRVKSGRRAVTEVRTTERFAGAAHVEVKLHTGRTHQIRVHLAEAGFPLLADSVYGRPRPSPAVREIAQALGRQALHAWKLAFTHPRTGKALRFEAPIPPDFAAAEASLRALA
jgi:23S rRNA pseudouridine1911/1915/1917 synthase